jgi:hypothetical protein
MMRLRLFGHRHAFADCYQMAVRISDNEIRQAPGMGGQRMGEDLSRRAGGVQRLQVNDFEIGVADVRIIMDTLLASACASEIL